MIFIFFLWKVCHESDSQVSDKPKIICFYPSQSYTRIGKGKFLPTEDFDINLCTDIIYSNAVLDNQTLLIKPGFDSESIKYHVSNYKVLTIKKFINYFY